MSLRVHSAIHPHVSCGHPNAGLRAGRLCYRTRGGAPSVCADMASVDSLKANLDAGKAWPVHGFWSVPRLNAPCREGYPPIHRRCPGKGSNPSGPACAHEGTTISIAVGPGFTLANVPAHLCAKNESRRFGYRKTSEFGVLEVMLESVAYDPKRVHHSLSTLTSLLQHTGQST